MSQTNRDRIWDATLQLIVRQPEVTIGDVIEAAELNEQHRQTARRTLRSMEDLGWVQQWTGGSPYWVAGEQLSHITG